jgi:hypothetical protein
MLPFKPLCPVPPRRCKCGEENLQVDEVVIEIDGVVMKMIRRSTLKVPAEVSAIIPRVEIRRRTFENGQLTMENEMILNSITIVHAPLHPTAGENPPETEHISENHLAGAKGGGEPETLQEVTLEPVHIPANAERNDYGQSFHACGKTGVRTGKKVPHGSIPEGKSMPDTVVTLNGSRLLLQGN